jgi:hypothetical protein
MVGANAPAAAESCIPGDYAGMTARSEPVTPGSRQKPSETRRGTRCVDAVRLTTAS